MNKHKKSIALFVSSVIIVIIAIGFMKYITANDRETRNEICIEEKANLEWYSSETLVDATLLHDELTRVEKENFEDYVKAIHDMVAELRTQSWVLEFFCYISNSKHSFDEIVRKYDKCCSEAREFFSEDDYEYFVEWGDKHLQRIAEERGVEYHSRIGHAKPM